MWNLGFNALFPKYVDNGIHFPVTSTMEVELGLIAAIALMGGAVQLRVLAVLKRKLHEIAEEQEKQEHQTVLRGADQIAALEREKEQWEKEHPTLPFKGRQASYSSSAAGLLKSEEHTSTSMDDKRSSTLTYGLDYMSDPDSKRAGSQSPGALPAMDLGHGIKDDVPLNYLQDGPESPKRSTLVADLEELAGQEALLSEIQEIRKSIEVLKSDTHSSLGARSRLSMTSRRTLSFDADSLLTPQRRPKQGDSRSRVQSMDLDRLAEAPVAGASIGRPTSVPLKDDKWAAYVQDRKLLQPPSGVTPPIATTPAAPPAPSRLAMSPAVTEALAQRKQRESAVLSSSDSDDIPIAAHIRSKTNVPTTSNVPIILPRQQGALPIVAPAPQKPQATRTATYEELAERHRRKMREMQAPLTKAQTDEAQLHEAKERWERSKENERAAVARRQVAQAAQHARRQSADDREPLQLDMDAVKRHSRHPSADKLAGPSSKRMSTMKVEDWKKYQQEQPIAGGDRRQSGQSRSPTSPNSPVSFPGHSRRESGYERRTKSPMVQGPPT